MTPDLTGAPALTLHRGWAACITDLPEPIAKRVENRSWTTRHRGPLLLHAGQRWDPAARAVCDQVTAAAHWADVDLSWTPVDHPTGIVALVGLVDICSASVGHDRKQCDCDMWAFPGQHHWQISNVRKLPEPVPAAGRLGLWLPAPDVLDAVRDQLAAAVTR